VDQEQKTQTRRRSNPPPAFLSPRPHAKSHDPCPQRSSNHYKTDPFSVDPMYNMADPGSAEGLVVRASDIHVNEAMSNVTNKLHALRCLPLC